MYLLAQSSLLDRIINNCFLQQFRCSSRAPDFAYKGLFVIYQFKGNQKKINDALSGEAGGQTFIDNWIRGSQIKK